MVEADKNISDINDCCNGYYNPGLFSFKIYHITEQFTYVWYPLLAWLLLSIALSGVGVLKLEKLYKAKSAQNPENEE